MTDPLIHLSRVVVGTCRNGWVIVMVDGPAVGKAGDCLDWIAGGLEIKGLRDSGNPCPL